MKITSAFAMIDVLENRHELLQKIVDAEGAGVPFQITGRFVAGGNDDGESIEFEAKVDAIALVGHVEREPDFKAAPDDVGKFGIDDYGLHWELVFFSTEPHERCVWRSKNYGYQMMTVANGVRTNGGPADIVKWKED